MTELKTLKDLNCDACDRDGHLGCGCPVSVSTEDLRKEAIKWVKDMRRSDTEHRNKVTSDTWARHFFNLTEEDLK